uniref:Uncharacterized protein MANES_03G010000 n=1 Tax=Rhizophora mucronata TaxID=61149 RepID=A0A2P2KM99_RHIMU
MVTSLCQYFLTVNIVVHFGMCELYFKKHCIIILCSFFPCSKLNIVSQEWSNHLQNQCKVPLLHC